MRTAEYKFKSLVYVTMILMFLSGALPFTAAHAQVKTDKDVYGPGETIKAHFFNAPGSSRDWICIVAAGSSDNDAGDYKYMPNGETQGILTFDAPTPGKYEVRAYYNYSSLGYVVAARHAFTVEATASPAKRVIPAETQAPAPLEIPTEQQIEAYITGREGPINVAVFHFTPLGMDASSYGTIVTNALINTPQMQSSFILLNRKDLEIFLSSNNLQQNDQLGNMVEIGSRLGMNFVIAGTVVKRGSRIVTSYKVVSVARRKVIYKNQFTATGEADLVNNVTKMSDAIAAAILKSGN